MDLDFNAQKLPAVYSAISALPLLHTFKKQASAGWWKLFRDSNFFRIPIVWCHQQQISLQTLVLLSHKKRKSICKVWNSVRVSERPSNESFRLLRLINLHNRRRRESESWPLPKRELCMWGEMPYLFLAVWLFLCSLRKERKLLVKAWSKRYLLMQGGVGVAQCAYSQL